MTRATTALMTKHTGTTTRTIRETRGRVDNLNKITRLIGIIFISEEEALDSTFKRGKDIISPKHQQEPLITHPGHQIITAIIIITHIIKIINKRSTRENVSHDLIHITIHRPRNQIHTKTIPYHSMITRRSHPSITTIIPRNTNPQATNRRDHIRMDNSITFTCSNCQKNTLPLNSTNTILDLPTTIMTLHIITRHPMMATTMSITEATSLSLIGIYAGGGDYNFQDTTMELLNEIKGSK